MERTLLPGLVRQYVESVLPDQVPSSRKVRVTQVGEMVLKPGRRPLRFDAVEEFAVDRVAFAWQARFAMLGPISLRVTDGYRPPEGSLEVRLLGLPLRRDRGPEVARGEAFRYLAEIPWAPLAILANRELAWEQLDEARAEVSTRVAGERIAVRFLFDGTEVVQTEADRPRLEAGGAVTRWVGQYSDYMSFNGVRMPSRGEVSWELPGGPFTYWRGTITSAKLCD